MLSVSGTANERKRKQPDKGKPLGSWALWLLPLGWMALIFAASHTPASDIPSLWFWTLPESPMVNTMRSTANWNSWRPSIPNSSRLIHRPSELVASR